MLMMLMLNIDASTVMMMIQWLEYMEGHERWWDAIWSAAAERGDQEVFSPVLSVDI